MARRKPTSVQVDVTRNMVDYALRQTSTQCAVALAIRDANDDWVLPRVTQETISWSDRRTHERVTIPTPPEVAKFIDNFDRTISGKEQSNQIKPFSFELNMGDATTRPMVRLQPSEMIAQAERDRSRVSPSTGRRQKKIDPDIRPRNTSKRELRPVTDG